MSANGMPEFEVVAQPGEDPLEVAATQAELDGVTAAKQQMFERLRARGITVEEWLEDANGCRIDAWQDGASVVMRMTDPRQRTTSLVRNGKLVEVARWKRPSH